MKTPRPPRNNRVPLTKFITFQVWLISVIVGIGWSVVVQSLVPLMIAPWIGLLLGVLLNEMGPGYVNRGV